MIVGIDLGTTNSLVGAMDAGFPVLFADAGGHRLTPSLVAFKDGGEPLVGRAAQGQPDRVASIKRLMGRRVGEVASPLPVAEIDAAETDIEPEDKLEPLTEPASAATAAPVAASEPAALVVPEPPPVPPRPAVRPRPVEPVIPLVRVPDDPGPEPDGLADPSAASASRPEGWRRLRVLFT